MENSVPIQYLFVDAGGVVAQGNSAPIQHPFGIDHARADSVPIQYLSAYIFVEAGGMLAKDH